MKIVKVLCAFIVMIVSCTCLSVDIYAISSEEKNNYLNISDELAITGEIIDTLSYMGLDYKTITEMFSISELPEGNIESFSLESTPLLTYKPEGLDYFIKYGSKTRVFDGNIPTSATEQASRMEFVTRQAVKTYGHLSSSRFQDYVYYLYMSHYVDNEQYDPIRPNFDGILATYLCQDDINVYNRYLQMTYGNQFFSGTKSILDTSQATLNGMDDLEDVRSYTRNIYNVFEGLWSTGEFLKDDAPILLEVLTMKWSDANDRIDFINKVNEDNNFASLSNDAVTTMTNAFIQFALGISGLQVIPYITGVGVMLDYYSNLFTIASLAALSYSWSGRIAVRTAIYVGMTPRPE